MIDLLLDKIEYFVALALGLLFALRYKSNAIKAIRDQQHLLGALGITVQFGPTVIRTAEKLFLFVGSVLSVVGLIGLLGII